MPKVCAHINYGPFQNGHKYFDSEKAAIEYFRSEVIDSPYRNGTSDESDGCYALHLYFDTDCDCDDAMNFHDYPDRAYSVGPRGGLRKDYI